LESDIDILLNRQYPEDGACSGQFDPENKNKKREEITRLNFASKGLKGELKLKEFSNLEILECDDNEITSLDISMCPKLKILNCGANQLKELNLTNNKELLMLFCWINEIKQLDITNLSDLETLACSSNFLTSLDLSKNLKLKRLDIADNNFSKQDLSFLSRLENLESLLVANSNRSTESVRNSFIGSLEPLKNTKLKLLSINGTDIDDKSFNLPGVKFLTCHTCNRPSSQAR
jgi:Leucine-rich repeat (LRR) protein